MDWTALENFNLVALHGGFGSASRASRRAKATLSRHVAELERALGVRLIERGGAGLRLTDEGRQLHEQTHGLMTEISGAGEGISTGAGTPRGTLRVSAPMVLAHVTLMPIAIRFCSLYPEVVLDIIAEDRPVDPVDDGYDIVLRIDPHPDERLVGRRVATDRRWVVAGPDEPLPGVSDDLPVRGVMMATVSATTRWRLRDANGTVRTVLPSARLRLSSLLMVRDAVIAGMGVALLPKLLVGPDVAAGRLRLWGESAGPPVEIWALHASRRLTSAKVRAFLSVLAEGLAEEARPPHA